MILHRLALGLVVALSIAGTGCDFVAPATPPPAAAPTATVDAGRAPARPADSAAANTPVADRPAAGTPAPGTVIADTIDGAPAVDKRWIAENSALGKALVGL